MTDIDLPAMRETLYSPEAERALIGSAIIDPAQLANGLGKVKPEWFYLIKHNWIWRALCGLGDGADIVTLAKALNDRQHLEESGGMAYLTQLINDTPSAYNSHDYAVIVERDYLRRGILEKASALAKAAYSDDDPLQQARAIAAEIDRLETSDSAFTDPYSAANEWYAELEHYVDTRAIPGVTTGYPLIDAKTLGLRRREFTILAARPAVGKTALAASMAYRQLRAGLRVCVFSLEMSVSEWLGRAVLSKLNLDYRRITRDQLGMVSAEAAAMANLATARYYERGNIPPEEIAAIAHRAANELGGLDCIWIDHLSYVAWRDRGNASYSIGRGLKVITQLAKDEGCAVVGLCQLNREAARESREPQLHDLRESGELEQDARHVWMLHRNTEPKDMAQMGLPDDAALFVRKSHNGPIGKIPMKFVRQSAQWCEVALP